MLGTTVLIAALAQAAGGFPPLHLGAPNLKYQQQVTNPYQASDGSDVAGQGGVPVRFEVPVCPTVIGTAADQATAITERMRRVAEAAGVPLARPGCEPNVFVMVTVDKVSFLDQQWRARPYLFPEDWSASQVHRLQRDPAPTAAWAVEELRNADGAPLNYGSEVGVNRTTRAPSRITPGARRYFKAAVIVLQADALEGLTTTQIADYAAMRTFAGADPAKIRGSTPPTILKLLDTPMGKAVPVTLTEWDLGMLKSLYASNPNVRGS